MFRKQLIGILGIIIMNTIWEALTVESKLWVLLTFIANYSILETKMLVPQGHRASDNTDTGGRATYNC